MALKAGSWLRDMINQPTPETLAAGFQWVVEKCEETIHGAPWITSNVQDETDDPETGGLWQLADVLERMQRFRQQVRESNESIPHRMCYRLRNVVSGQIIMGIA